MSEPRFNAPLIVVVSILIALVLAMSGVFLSTLSVLLLIFAGILFGVLIHAVSVWPARRFPFSYRVTFLLVVGAMLLTMGLCVFYLGSQLIAHADELWVELQSAAETATERWNQSSWANNKHLPELSDVQTQITQSSSDIVPAMFRRLQSVGWAMTAALVIFFVGLYAAFDPDLYRTGLVKLVPIKRRPRAQQVLERLRSSLERWIVGRLFSMAIVGVATSLGMWLFGVPLPISLGVLAALLTFIPNIGPLLATIPQMLLAVNLGTQMVLYVLLFNVVLQTIESYLITPIVQQQEVSLPPILTIAAQLLMGVIAGVLGVMMAAPLVVVLMVLIQMLYVHDQLEDSDST